MHLLVTRGEALCRSIDLDMQLVGRIRSLYYTVLCRETSDRAARAVTLD